MPTPPAGPAAARRQPLRPSRRARLSFSSKPLEPSSAGEARYLDQIAVFVPDHLGLAGYIGETVPGAHAQAALARLQLEAVALVVGLPVRSEAEPVVRAGVGGHPLQGRQAVGVDR